MGKVKKNSIEAQSNLFKFPLYVNKDIITRMNILRGINKSHKSLNEASINIIWQYKDNGGQFHLGIGRFESQTSTTISENMDLIN